MAKVRFSRREVLGAPAALALSSLFWRVSAASPAPSDVTPALIAAARREGKVAFYTAMELTVAERLARAFEATHAGIAVNTERTGSERLFQRIGQEYASGIHAADVVNSADAAHFIVWKRNGWLARYIPVDVARHYPLEARDPDGTYAVTRVALSVIGYNTNLVKSADAPNSFADLLEPKWAGKIVKGHPAYSGTILTATFQMARDLGWSYFEKLAQQKVMQVQSANDPPKKLALGERAVMADGNEYMLIQLKDAGQPVEVVYPAEGAPLVLGPSSVFAGAPNPNAARLLQSWLFSIEAQQLLVDLGLRSFHLLVKEKPGRRPLRDIKVMKDDAAAVEAQSEEIKARYARLFRV
jgi:iron(III) transport system substrate-binding protein